MTDSLTPSRMTEIADLREILRSLQIANETPNGPISDTIWMASGHETVFDALYDVIERLAAAGERAPLQGAEAGRAVAQRMLANPGMRSILQNLKDGAAGERVGDDFSGCRPPMRHIAGVSEETLRRAAGERVDAKAHEWEDADDVTMARAEVLSLIGLLAELDRMEQENRDDSLGGYCGAQVADFKRRYREAIARNGGAPAGERVDAPVEPTDKQLTDRWNELSYYYTPPYSWLEKMRVMLREFAASPADAPQPPAGVAPSDDSEPVFHLRSYGDVSREELERIAGAKPQGEKR